MAGPLLGVMQQMSGAMFGTQVGQGLGTLATEVLGSTDIALPLAPASCQQALPPSARTSSTVLSAPMKVATNGLAGL